MSNLNVYAELLSAETEINQAQKVLDRKKKTVGRLPIYRGRLESLQIHLDYQRNRVDAAKKYLEDTTPELQS